MDVARFAIRRLLISIPVLLLASIMVFLMVANSGDPLSDLVLNPRIPKIVIQRRKHELFLDRPILTRYRLWVTHFVTGNFGKTIDGRDVKSLLFHRMFVTFRMVFLAMLIAIVLAIIVGVVSAVRQYSLLDHATTFIGFLLLAMPVFWLAALLDLGAINLNQKLHHRYLYTIGDSTPNLTGGFLHNIGNYAGHLVLPTLTLAAISYAAWSRFQRASMLDVLNSDYVRLARAKGISRGRVLIRHALRNALIPLTTVVSIDFGAILGGAVITEKVFAWKGMGDVLIDGVVHQDTNELLAWLMLSAIMVILFNLAADLLYGVLDPRIRA
jgi:peptide/nickel transport system permease protein